MRMHSHTHAGPCAAEGAVVLPASRLPGPGTDPEETAASVASAACEVYELALSGLPGPGLVLLEVEEGGVLGEFHAVLVEEAAVVDELAAWGGRGSRWGRLPATAWPTCYCPPTWCCLAYLLLSSLPTTACYSCYCLAYLLLPVIACYCLAYLLLPVGNKWAACCCLLLLVRDRWACLLLPVRDRWACPLLPACATSPSPPSPPPAPPLPLTLPISPSPPDPHPPTPSP